MDLCKQIRLCHNWSALSEQLSPVNDTLLALAIASALDRVGEPPARWHPVVWYGKLIAILERGAPQRPLAQVVYGAAMLAAATLAVLPPLLLVQAGARLVQKSGIHRSALLFALIEGILLKSSFSLKMLADTGMVVRVALEKGEVLTARQALGSLVSRDRSYLTPGLIAMAAIESLAENVSDSVVAPLFYYVLFGLPGAMLYRLFNTFDAMIGYHGRYEYLGKAAARLDDLLNLVPSRMTALLIIVGAPLFSGSSRGAWRIWRRDAYKTASPNAGQPMAAMAGALGIQLEKVGHYALGDAIRPVATQDMKHAEAMVWRIGSIAFLLAAIWKIYRSNRHA